MATYRQGQTTPRFRLHPPLGVRAAAATLYLLGFAAAAQPPAPAWTTNEDFLVFFEAVHEIATKGLEPIGSRDAIERSLTLLMDSLDPYSAYLSPASYAAYRDTLREEYAGVGMEILQAGGGDILCFPHPGGPAAQAGIRPGDRLLAVDGERPDGATLMEIGTRIRGPEGSQVRLLIRDEQGREQTRELTRGRVQQQTVVPFDRDGIQGLRILGFTPRTADAIRKALRDTEETGPLILDIRSNPGGDLYGAVDAARLFLGEGQVICTTRHRDGERTYRADRAPAFPDRPLVLIQGRYTASAAEVFAAALVQNGRARSIGERTFGKGTTQKIIELIDGSAVVLTDALLLTPNGLPYEGAGLEPGTYLDLRGMDEADVYRAAVQEEVSGER